MEDEEQKPFTDEEVEQILKDALKVKLEERKKYPNKVQLKKAMVTVVGEFLTCFKIVGYDYEGQLINLTCYKTPMDKAALDNAVLDEFTRFMGRG